MKMQTSVKLQSITMNAEREIMRTARVSSKHPNSDNVKLLYYLTRERHWSPFEMANMCVLIECPRVIGRQILRHRSFSFQELSQRYKEIDDIVPFFTDARSQDKKNRQKSNDNMSEETKQEWRAIQEHVWNVCRDAYKTALDLGISRECSRSVLPEGMTTTKMYMNGTIRSYIHYCSVRLANGTQPEHIEVARQIVKILCKNCPNIGKAMGWLLNRSTEVACVRNREDPKMIDIFDDKNFLESLPEEEIPVGEIIHNENPFNLMNFDLCISDEDEDVSSSL